MGSSRVRLLVLTRHNVMGASSRVRFLQYLPWLANAGFDVEVRPFFGDKYLRRLYESGRRMSYDIFFSYLRRFATLLGARRYSALWVEKELLPLLPSVIERIPAFLRVPYIVDYDDNTFYAYESRGRSIVGRFLSRKLDALVAGAACVTAGNSYLGATARAHGAKRVEIVPTVVDVQRYRVTRELDGREFRIGWIGSPLNTKYLNIVRSALKRLNGIRPTKLVTIGASDLGDFGLPVEQHAWSNDTEGELLESIHVGIMPLPDTPWERGKCGYKLIQYLAVGRPVVGSPVGVNRDIITKSVGFQADGEEQWLEALRFFSTAAELRRDYGKAGRLLVEQEYSLQAVAPKLIAIVDSVIGDGI